MLYGLKWLNPDKEFPPQEEADRINAYKHYAELFDVSHFKDFNNYGSRLIANFDEYIKLPVLLAYQRMSTIKLADMAIGAPPSFRVHARIGQPHKAPRP